MSNSVAPSERAETPITASSRPLRPGLFLCFFVIAALVYLGTTGVLPLVGRDEPRYVQIGREMLDSGDWITPRLGGFTWFEKPVLLYWMVAASFSVFGISEWAARLGPALCGLGSAALLWWALRPQSLKSANWSALTALSSGGMIAFSHGATFDIALTCCVTLALCGWWRAQSEPENSRKFLAIFWAGVGLAFLAKGLVAFVLTLGTIGVYALLRRERVKLGLWWGLPLALVVSALWYGPVFAANGRHFFDVFFVQHQFQRFTSDKFKHHQPPWFYLEILPLLTLPWTPFLLASLWKTRLLLLREATPESRLHCFALAWMLVPVAFFSASGSKLPGYILPAIPGAAILMALQLGHWAGDVKRERFMLGLTAAMLGLAMLLTLSPPTIALAEKQSVRSLFRSARERGLGHLRVVSFATTSRPAQFYAASTLIYGEDGEPLRLETLAQVRQMTQIEPLLILIDRKNQQVLAKSGLKLETVADNGKIALILAQR